MKWEAKQIVYKNENRIAVYFEKNQHLIDRIKKLDGARWSQSKKIWHLPDTFENRERFKIVVSQQKVLSEEGVDYIFKIFKMADFKAVQPKYHKNLYRSTKGFSNFL